MLHLEQQYQQEYNNDHNAGAPIDAPTNVDVDGNNDDDDNGTITGQTTLAQVFLAWSVYKRYHLAQLTVELNLPHFPQLIQRFLYD